MKDNNNIDREEHGLISDKELKEIDDKLKRIEKEGARDILKYFDRIHDKLFSFNNMLIAGYFTLPYFFDSFSVYNIFIPIINMVLLLLIDYRLMEKSRFDAEITKKPVEEILNKDSSVNRTTRYSLCTIIFTAIVAVIFLYNLFSLVTYAQ